MYVPVNPPQAQGNSATSLFSKGGINKRDLPQLLDPKFAIKIQNYYITSDGGLKKRKGITELVDTTGDSITMLEQFTPSILMVGYNTSLAAYDLGTATLTVIKNDFVESEMEGAKYGDYFFVASGGDKVGRVSRTLDYDAQTANFTVGAVLTGGTSGAKAIILQDSDSGATGTLTLGSVDGVFVDNETITDSSGGSATENGTVTYTYTAISAAPYAKRLKVFGNRLVVGQLRDDPFSVRYSEVDTGTNPPFNTWSNGTLATDGGVVSYRNAGAVQSIDSLGNIIVVFSLSGKWAFTINTLDVGGTQRKNDSTVIDRQDFGGFRGSITTPKGLFYVNEAGLWQLSSLGQPNIPYSDQENLATLILGVDYFVDIDLSNASLAYDKRLNTLLISCAKNSVKNNLIIAFNVDQGAVSEFTGLNISRLLLTEDLAYAGSSSNGLVYNLFDGYSDNGNDIWTIFYTELKANEMESRSMLLGTYIQGIFSLSTELRICYDIYDVEGNFIPEKLCQTWFPNDSVSPKSGWGIDEWGGSSWGGEGSESENMIESFSGAKNYIRNFQRIRVKITGNDQLPHELNWVKLLFKPKVQIRRRNLIKANS